MTNTDDSIRRDDAIAEAERWGNTKGLDMHWLRTAINSIPAINASEAIYQFYNTVNGQWLDISKEDYDVHLHSKKRIVYLAPPSQSVNDALEKAAKLLEAKADQLVAGNEHDTGAMVFKSRHGEDAYNSYIEAIRALINTEPKGSI